MNEDKIEINPVCLEQCEKASRLYGLYIENQEILSSLQQTQMQNVGYEIGHAATEANKAHQMVADELEHGNISPAEADRLIQKIEAADTSDVPTIATDIMDQIVGDRRIRTAERLFGLAERGEVGQGAAQHILGLMDELDEQKRAREKDFGAKIAAIYAKHGTTEEEFEKAKNDRTIEDDISDVQKTIELIESDLSECVGCTGPISTGESDNNGKEQFVCPKV